MAQARVARPPALAVVVPAGGGGVYTVQTHGVLDDAFYYDGPLGCGVHPTDGARLALWAPTAQRVRALLSPVTLSKALRRFGSTGAAVEQRKKRASARRGDAQQLIRAR